MEIVPAKEWGSRGLLAAGRCALALCALALSALALRALGWREQPRGERLLSSTSDAVAPSIFFLVTLTVSALAQHLVKVLPNEFRPPHSVLLYFVGSFMSWLAHVPAEHSEFGEAILSFAYIDPHIIFWVMLPALLYEDAAGSDWHVVKRVLPSALLLAVPGVILNTVLTGVFVRYCMLGWEWPASLLLGSVLSATDPVAVIGALTALNAPAKLSHLISGESLFNDGSAVALFQIFKGVTAGEAFEPVSAVATLCKVAVGGPIFGLAVAMVAVAWLKRTGTLSIEVLIIIVCVYGTFIVGEHSLHVSGVLAVVTFGLAMSAFGRFALNVETEHEYHAIMKFLSLISHESIFIIAGVIGYRFLSDTEVVTWRAFGELVLLYLVIHATRALVIGAFWPLLMRMGYGLTWREAAICIFGGLRGAVGLAMALLLPMSGDIPEQTVKKIGFYTAGIVVLTLLINGTMISWVYKKLKVDPSGGITRHHEKLLRIGLLEADTSIAKHLGRFKRHWFYHNCNLELVERLIPKLSELVDPAKRVKSTSKPRLRALAEERVSAAITELAGKFALGLEGDPDFLRAHCTAKLEKSKSHSEEWISERHLKHSAPKDAGARFKTFVDSTSSASKSKDLDNDHEMTAEVFQTVINAMAAEYKEAYEERTLAQAPYRLLTIACTYEEEAVWGELGLPKYGVPAPDFLQEQDKMAEIEAADRQIQMQKSFEVGWLYLSSMLGRPRRLHIKLLYRFFGQLTVALDWNLLRRDVAVVKQFVNTCEHILEDTRILDGFTEILTEPLMQVKTQAMSEAMRKCMEFDFGMFVILEHVLCAHHVLVHAQKMVRHLGKEGTLREEDVKRIFKLVINPTLHALDDFVPTRKQLELLHSHNAHKVSPMLDRFMYDLVFERSD